DNHSDIFSDSKNDDDIQVTTMILKMSSMLKHCFLILRLSVKRRRMLFTKKRKRIRNFCDHTEETRSGNTTTHANDSLPEYDLFCFETEPDQERLINAAKNDISDYSSNDPLLEETNFFLASDNSIPPGIENFGDDAEGDIHFLEELLIDDSIPFPNNESSESNFDNPSFLRPPLKPPDAEFIAEDEILVVMNDELECLDLRNEFDDDGFTPHRLKFLVFRYLSRSKRSSHPFFEISLGKSISLISIA
nr:hypothetical protein [Tanacetum cinerariifolium]